MNTIPTKPEGEYTIENNLTSDEAADRFANKWPHVAMKCARESFLSGANWQSQQPGYQQYLKELCKKFEHLPQDIKDDLISEQSTERVERTDMSGVPQTPMKDWYKELAERITPPSTSTTIEELAENIFNEYFDLAISPLKTYTHASFKSDALLMIKAAYSLRDKEQATLTDKIKKLIEMQERSAIRYKACFGQQNPGGEQIYEYFAMQLKELL